MGVGGSLFIRGRENAPGILGARALQDLLLLKMAVHRPDRKNGLAREAQRANISGTEDSSPPKTLQHLPALQNRVNWIGNLNCREFWMKRSIGKKRLKLHSG